MRYKYTNMREMPFFFGDEWPGDGPRFKAEIPSGITSTEELHRVLKELLHFPENYQADWGALNNMMKSPSWLPDGPALIKHMDLPLKENEETAKTYLNILKNAALLWSKYWTEHLIVLFPISLKDQILQMTNIQEPSIFTFNGWSGKTGFNAEVPSGITSEKELHKNLKKVLCFPNYYGENWNALDEVMADLDWLPKGDTVIKHKDLPLINNEKAMGIYLNILKRAGMSWFHYSDRSLVIIFPALLKDIVLKAAKIQA